MHKKSIVHNLRLVIPGVDKTVALTSTVVHYTLSAYPDLSKCFNIHTDASDYHIGEVIIQEVKILAFYRCKLTGTQI